MSFVNMNRTALASNNYLVDFDIKTWLNSKGLDCFDLVKILFRGG